MKPWKALLLLGIPLALLVLAPVLDLRDRVTEWAQAADDLGPAGPLAFIAFYVVATVAGLPSGPMVVAGGVLFGPVRGLLVVTVGGVLAASAAYWFARWFAGRQTRRWLEECSWWAHLQPLLREHAGPVVALVRMLPGLPYPVQNYALALSGVPFGTYVLWTAVGILPLGLLTIVGTEAVVRGLRDGEPTPWLVALFLALSLVLMAGLNWARRRVLSGGLSK